MDGWELGDVVGLDVDTNVGLALGSSEGTVDGFDVGVTVG